VAPRTQHAPTALDPDRQLELLEEPQPEPITRTGGAARAGSPSERSRQSARRRSLARLAVSPDEAAELLGVSRDYFDEHVIRELRVVRRGRRILIAVSELERWLDHNAARATTTRKRVMA
jgi:excisionase family DNA binding protein